MPLSCVGTSHLPYAFTASETEYEEYLGDFESYYVEANKDQLQGLDSVEKAMKVDSLKTESVDVAESFGETCLVIDH